MCVSWQKLKVREKFSLKLVSRDSGAQSTLVSQARTVFLPCLLRRCVSGRRLSLLGRAFGVLLWEMFTYGYMPYPGQSNLEVMYPTGRTSR